MMASLGRFWAWLFPMRELRLGVDAPPDAVLWALGLRVQRSGLRSRLFATGLVGRLDARRLRIWWQRAWVSNSSAPMFEGTITVDGGRTWLIGRIGVRTSTRRGFGSFAGFIVFWWVAAAASLAAWRPPALMWLPFVLGPPAMIGFAVGVTRLGVWMSSDDADRIEWAIRDAVAELNARGVAAGAHPSTR